MRVKRLEIQGFKSFKDKTVIHFDHSITGIVGPNGCGKSNIVDAFFWVMGEQSYKHIRGSGSDDLIFNGSAKYTPLGLAEATLVMETDIFDTTQAPAGASADGEVSKGPVIGTRELSVTRRLYRGGEGEYFINGVQARLKDIHELFLDTGVGTKGYSVIEQGQIGKIVNSKPEERRQLIEEAAGIAKYKARKKESLRKIEATETNLARLTDIIQEIERSRDQLERQAQKAVKYKEYKGELFEKEMVWGRRKNKLMLHRLHVLKTERDRLEAETQVFRARLQATENELETFQIAQLTTQKEIDQAQGEFAEISRSLTQDQSALELSRQRQEDLSQQILSLDKERAELSTNLESSRVQQVSQLETVEGLRSEQAQVVEQASSWTEKLLTAQREAASARKLLDDAKKDWLGGMTQASEFQAKLAGLKVKFESGREQKDRYGGELKSLSDRENQLNEDLSQLQRSAVDHAESRNLAQVTLGELQQAFTQEEQRCGVLQKEREERNHAAVHLESRLQSLKEIAASHEGLGHGAKAALAWGQAQREGGAFELLAEMYEVHEVDAEFDHVLEAWLEGRLESLIAAQGSEGLDVLAHLRSEKQGRASIQFGFVPEGYSGKRQTLPAAQALEVAAGHGFKVLGELKQFIRVSSKVELIQNSAIAQSLLEGALVVDSLESLRSIESMLDFVQKLGGWSLISRDGMVLTGEAVLRGGSVDPQSVVSILGQRRAIQTLETQVGEAQELLKALDTSLQQSRLRVESLRQQVKEAHERFQRYDLDHVALVREIQQLERVRADVSGHRARVEVALAEILASAEKAEAEWNRVEAQRIETTKRHQEIEQYVAHQDQDVLSKDAVLKEIETGFQKAKIAEASLKERLSGAQRELENIQGLIQDREKRIHDLQQWLERVMLERQERTGTDSDLHERIAEGHRLSGVCAERLAASRDQMEQIQAKIQAGAAATKELYQSIDQSTALTQTHGLEVEKLSSEHAFLKQNLEEKYGTGCLDSEPVTPEQESLPDPVVTQEMSEEEERELNEEVARLRERIRRLGEVNPMAIEEYEEIKRRYEILVTEKADLVTSIQHLHEAIDHINRTSEDRFRQAFEAIKNRFEKLFPIIFGGGHAELTLVASAESADILDAGIEILAQPPGKKVVNITLLSGGEKALTAVCLIFAIFMVKPSPFCILDEVDAPLDDANIGKFNALLKEMSSKTQFILITHNKKTMELNDTLYGVTMEEPGVSKMISIEMS